ncbi:MAG: hypothetical protein KF817_14950 [Phycisphaeraceae bacterium]|nr:hypothetical protein [Phycisphaeraceae bacterium]
MALTCMLPGLGDVTRSAQADPPQYEMTEIAILRFAPDADIQGRFGINRHGQSAFTRRVVIESVETYRATLFLPEAAYGLSAGVHDLGSLFSLTGHSYARDIGDAGFVVGQVDGVESGHGSAFIIDLADHLSLQDQILVYAPTLDEPCSSPWARAMAVTNDEDPVGCGIGIGVLPSTLAFDADRSPANALLRAGMADRQRRDGTCGFSGPTPCGEDGLRTRPLRWNPSMGVLQSLGEVGNDPELRQAAARGVNAAGHAVGWSLDEEFCVQHSVIWPAGSTSPADLHGLVSAIADRSRAESINRCGFMPQVAGWDPLSNKPLLWLRDAVGDWHGWLLQVGGGSGVAEIQCDTCDDVRLTHAFDINDAGQIIVWGVDDSATVEAEKYRLYLLTPIPTCERAGDIDGDGEVGFTDLVLLLAWWGDCDCPWCPADLDGNGLVGFADLLIILANWGPCSEPSMGLPKSLEDCIARVGYDPVALSACIATIE